MAAATIVSTTSTPNATVNTVFSVTWEGRTSFSNGGKGPMVGDRRLRVKRFGHRLGHPGSPTAAGARAPMSARVGSGPSAAVLSFWAWRQAGLPGYGLDA